MKEVVMVLAGALIALPILAEEKKPTATPAPAKSSQPQGSTPTPDAQRGKPSKEQKMTGRVIRLSGNTFTVLSGGKEVTFSAAKPEDLPKVGETVDITYTETPNGPQARTIIRSKSNITNN